MFTELHSSFRLNNKSYTTQSLKNHAQALLRSKEVHEVEIGDFLLDWLEDDTTVEASTSGSTGAPKLLQLSKDHMVNSAKATGTFFKVPAETNALLCLSVKYIAGKMMLVRAMVLGWRLDVVAPKSNPLDQVYKQYDFCAMVPFQLDNSVNRLHLIKKIIVGGGQIPGHLVAMIQGIATKIYETYGMTETVTHIAARRVNSKKKTVSQTHFKALPQVVLSTDNRNCLVIKAPMVADGIITTNDIVDLISYKKFYWKGRIDNIINSGGIKIHPEELERKLQLIIRERFFVAAIPHKSLGEQLILVVENYTDTVKTDILLNKIKLLEDITKYEIPKHIFLTNTFIETPTGKVHRTKNLEHLAKTIFLG